MEEIAQFIYLQCRLGLLLRLNLKAMNRFLNSTKSIVCMYRTWLIPVQPLGIIHPNAVPKILSTISINIYLPFSKERKDWRKK